MANKIQIKRGPSAPQANNLDVGELGYDTTSKKLYVGNIDENGNAADPTLINVDVDAAPAGYGLGADPKTIAFSDADTTYHSGWYKFSSQFTVNGSTYNYGYMRVDAYNSTACTQTLYIISAYGITFKRWRSNNNWSDWVEITHSVFAPAGYGLGSENSQHIGNKDANDIVENGWYLWNTSTYSPLNVPFTAGKMLVVARDGGKYCTQIAFEANKTTSIKVRSQGYDETWSDWVNWSPSAFAPSGYGLGAISYNIPLTTNANDAFRNGWYLINGDTTNGVGYAATLRVEGYSPNYVVQTAYRHTSSKIITWRRYCVSGTWTEWEDITPVAGSGLGVLPLYIDDLNTCLKNGWYAFSDGCANRPEGLSHGSVLVVNRDAKRTTQILFGINIDGNPQMIRYTTDSGVTWIEEWVNPKMIANTEYRTTERILSKAVYKKADANGNISYRLDGESTWYPERTQIIKLWNNASPASTFNKQTVSLDLSKYQMVAIEYRFNTTDDYRKMYIGNVGSTMALDVVSTSGYLGWRSAAVSTTGISFSAATYNGNSNVVGYIIPVAIYGIKGVI